jgi:hypothetical protein
VLSIEGRLEGDLGKFVSVGFGTDGLIIIVADYEWFERILSRRSRHGQKNVFMVGSFLLRLAYFIKQRFYSAVTFNSS